MRESRIAPLRSVDVGFSRDAAIVDISSQLQALCDGGMRILLRYRPARIYAMDGIRSEVVLVSSSQVSPASSTKPLQNVRQYFTYFGILSLAFHGWCLFFRAW